MHKIPSFILLMLISSGCSAQVIGRVDKKSKEFVIAANQKVDYTVYGYQLPNATTPKLICFSTNQDVVRANSTDKLGAYFDTYRMPPGDKITYMGLAGTFIKLNYISGGGSKTVFYLPKANFTIR